MQEATARSDAPSYFTELGQHRRALIATCCGLGAGFLLNHYIANLFAPHLIAEFGWSRSDFALLGSLGLINVAFLPVIGRMTDLFGVRAVALVGVIGFPVTLVAYAFMPGSLLVYTIITMVQLLLAGATTSSTVYSRLVAERFVTARGLALAIAATAPAIVGGLGTPMLEHVITAYGWRAGYTAVAIYVGVVGALAVLLAPAMQQPSSDEPQVKRKASRDYPAILQTPAFWILAGGMLLCNLVYPLQSSQMKLMLTDYGMDSSTATGMISLLAAGVVTGRILCGLALDRLPPHLVAAVCMGLPGIGLHLIAMGMTETWVLAGAVAIIGFSLGAESDLAAFLVVRYFRIDIYGSVLSLVVTAIALSASLGSIILGLTLREADSFDAYLTIAGTANLVGGGMFLLLARSPASQPASHAALAPGAT